MSHHRSIHHPVGRLGVLCLVGAALLASTGSASAGSVTCESVHNQQGYCRADTRGGVSLDTQLSRSPCRQGSTWGYDDRGIWVSNGCRAVFHTGEHRRESDHSNKAAAALAGVALLAIGAAAAHESHENHHSSSDDYRRYDDHDRYNDHHRGRHDRNSQVLCESSGDRYNYCNADTRHASVHILRQHSKSDCRFNRDWGYDRGGIWVDNGCRATFEIER